MKTFLWLCTMFTLLACGMTQDDDDDEVQGPLMPVKNDNSLYTTAELIELQKMKAEMFTVATEDGYLLQVYRIVPEKLPASPILLQHGYLASSESWLTDPDSLAFKLSKAGFDVFLSNARGNANSRSHATLKVEDQDFWQYSYHEIGTKDIPAVVDHILKVTGQPSVHLIGHSMGTTVSFITASLRPEYNAKLKSIVCLAPIVFLSKMVDLVGPGGMVEDIATKYINDFKAAKKLEVFPRKDQATAPERQVTCDDIEDNFRSMCAEKMEEAQKVLGGAYLPAGQSFKTLNHFYQMAVYGVMRHFNMSVEENQKAYGAEEPPKYTDQFGKITAPVLLYSTEADQAVLDDDVKNLVSLLPNLVSDNRIKEECFDHVAFLFPRTKGCIPVRAKLYEDIIEAVKKLDTK